GKFVFFGYELKMLISTAGGRFHFITAQGRHLFKETTFTVSTLPRAWLEPRANRMLVMKALRQWFWVGRAITRSPRTRKTATALHRTKKIDLYFRGVASFRSNQRFSASDYE